MGDGLWRHEASGIELREADDASTDGTARVTALQLADVMDAQL